MAPQKSPAFQFYPKDFTSGTATMSLQEVGAYVRLLCYAWDAGSVPADANERARILGCAKSQEVALWKKVSQKFVLSDGVYLNERMEVERRKQSEYRRRQSDRGKASAEARTNQRSSAGSTSVPTPVQPRPVESRLEPEGNSSSSSSFKNLQTHTARVNGQGNGAHPPGSLPRDHRYHAICGPRMRVCLTEATAAKLTEKWGGSPDDAMPYVREFCDWLEQRIGDGAKGDFLWLVQHFEAFMEANGRVPVAPPQKVKPAKQDGVAAAIDNWGRE